MLCEPPEWANKSDTNHMLYRVNANGIPIHDRLAHWEQQRGSLAWDNRDCVWYGLGSTAKNPYADLTAEQACSAAPGVINTLLTETSKQEL